MDKLIRIVFFVCCVTICDADEVKICTADFFSTELDPFNPCPLDNHIKLTEAVFGVSAQASSDANATDQCPSAPGDCTVDIFLERPDDLSSFQQFCSSFICEEFIVKASQLTCGGLAVFSDYMAFNYTCEPANKPLKYSSTCVGNAITDVKCPADYAIRVKQTLYVYTGTAGCPHTDTNNFKCIANVTTFDTAFYTDIISNCEDKEACKAGFIAKTASVKECGGETDVNFNNLIIGYECVPVIKVSDTCTDQPLTPTCQEGFVIDVISVYFGDEPQKQTLTECQSIPHTNSSCLIDVKLKRESFFNDVITACDGSQACSGLVAKAGPLGACYSNQQSDFVRIYYTCAVSNITTIPPTQGTGETTQAIAATTVTQTTHDSPESTEAITLPSETKEAVTDIAETKGPSTNTPVTKEATTLPSGVTTVKISLGPDVSTDAPQTKGAETTTKVPGATSEDKANETTTAGEPDMTTSVSSASGLSLTVIIIIAVVSAVVLIVIIAVLCVVCRRGPTNAKGAGASNAMPYNPYAYQSSYPGSTFRY